eukprot:g12575.t1
MWGNVVTNFDRRDLFSEKTMNYLDADPFVLFGIDDLITQKALRKLDKFPVLLCRGVKPDSEEWFAYLELDPEHDAALGWIVQSLAEMELWCWRFILLHFKALGIGSIVCFLNHQTGRSTWKHPFYDYFAQLKTFALTASPDHVKQCRLNRLIWSYETQGPSGALQEPLVSPEYVEHLAEIMGYDLAAEPYIVRDLKTYIKIFAHSYRTAESVAIEDVLALQEAVELNRGRTDLIQDTWKGLKDLIDRDWPFTEMPVKEDFKTAKRLYEEENEIIQRLASGEVMCVECDNVALSYCTMFGDYMCLACFARLHQKGSRRNAKAYKLEVCQLCKSKAAKLQCGYTGRLFCLECFAMKHIKELPPHAREVAPTKIHYHKMAAPKNPDEEADDAESEVESEVDSELGILGAQWAPFFDAKGIQFYYNFATGERMRRSPRGSSGDSEASTPVHSRRKEAKHGLQLDDELSESNAESGLLDALEDEAGVMIPAGGQAPKKNRLIKEPPTLYPRPIKPPYRTNPLSEGERPMPKRR